MQLAKPIEIYGLGQDLDNKCIYFLKLKFGTLHKISLLFINFLM